MTQSRKVKHQQKLMDSAVTYAEWYEAARVYDEISGSATWRKTEQSNLYDHAQLRLRLDRLRNYRSKQDNHGLLFTLNEGVHGNMGGMGKSILYTQSPIGTKHLIEDYVEEIASAIEHIATLDHDEISLPEKLDFFHRASHCYGRSALMLSGGGSLGNFHVGVMKALSEQDLMPNVLSGASAGSVCAAIFGTRTPEQMQDFLQPENLVTEAKEEASWFNRMFFGKKPQIDIHEVEETINRLIPNLTFQEAYELTGCHINISVAPAEYHQRSRLLNSITSPNVYIRKAVMASCAVPGVFPSVTLEAKNVHGESQEYLPSRKWVDGSVSDDLPAKRLARLYGVNHYVGSLINPIVLFSTEGSGDHGRWSSLMRKVAFKSVAEVSRQLYSFSQQYTQDMPRFNMASSMAHSIFTQKYEADIKIFPDFRNINLRKIISHLTADELLMLVRMGEQATWRKVAMLQTCSKISRTLDNVLEQYDEEEFRHRARKREVERKQPKSAEPA
jgi:NTE family protein